MARAQVPTIDPRDPDGVRKALRAIELILQQHGDSVDLLLAQRATVPVDEVARAPDNTPVPTDITTTINKDGSLTVELRWKYAQGARPSTQTVIVIKKGTAPLKIPVYWEDDVYTVPTGALYARIDLPSEHNYRFGIAVARGTPGGLEVGPVQAPTANPDWADITGGAPVLDVPGLITGVRNVLAADVTLTEATWVQVAALTVVIPVWAVDTKVLLTTMMNMGLGITAAGVVQMLWRWKRAGTVIMTSNAVRYDTSSPSMNASLWVAHISPWMDQTTLTGSVIYSLEFFKDDLSGTSTMTAKAASQIAASHWSYK